MGRSKAKKVSVIVPVYNVASYLEECLDSILNQTLQEMEIICVNDGSTDESGEILEKYRKMDTRVIVVNKANAGYGHSMNVGLRIATGEYIGIVESDDFVEPNMFEQLYKAAKKVDAQVVKSNYYEVETMGEIKRLFYENLINVPYNEVLCPLQNIGVFYVAPSIWSGIYKKSFLLENNIMFLETPGASYQDTSFSTKVWLMAERAYFIKDAYVNYRTDREGSSMNNKGKLYCICDEYEEIERYVTQYCNHLGIKMMLTGLKYKSYMWNYRRITEEFKEEFFRYMYKEFEQARIDGYINRNLIPLEVFKDMIVRFGWNSF